MRMATVPQVAVCESDRLRDQPQFLELVFS
jgi:hypothetical protein